MHPHHLRFASAHPPWAALAALDGADIPAGSTVIGISGEAIGITAAIYLDNQTGEPRWATVTTGGHRCLVPLTEARVDGDAVRVPFTADQVTSAPHHDPATALTVDDERDLDRHYAVHDGALRC